MLSLIQKNWDKLLLAILIGVYIITFSTLSILRHNAFSSALDLGNMDQTVWNTLNGNFFSLTNNGQNVSRLAVHGDFLLVLFAPLYALWSNPRILLIAQSIYLGLGAVPLFLIAKSVLRNRAVALGFVLIYLLNPLIQWVNIFDFHTVSFMVPAFLSLFYCALNKRWKWYWLWFVLILLTKEETALQVFLFGISLWVVFKNRKIGVLTSLISGLWFCFLFFILMPKFSQSGEHWALAWYQNDGVGSLMNRVLFLPEIQNYYNLLLRSFGFLPLFGFPWLLLAGPEIVINVLSSHSEMHSIQYHYTSGIIPILLIAAIYGVRYFSSLIRSKAAVVSGIVVGGALLIVLRTNYHYSPLPTTESCWCIVYRVTQEDIEFEKILQSIPQSASVTSSTEIHGHVSQRKEAYMLPYATESAQFIALIDQNRVIDNYGPKQEERGLIRRLNKEKKYLLITKIGHFYLYKKN